MTAGRRREQPDAEVRGSGWVGGPPDRSGNDLARTDDLPFGLGHRMLTLAEVCGWLNVTERHVRKLVERGAIPYRKVGRLLRFPEAEVERWSLPTPRERRGRPGGDEPALAAKRGKSRSAFYLPRSLIE